MDDVGVGPGPGPAGDVAGGHDGGRRGHRRPRGPLAFPALHNAAFAELRLDWAYVAFPVPSGRARAAVAAMADLGIRGLSVTMPHKAGAAEACQRLSPVAERLGVVNTVTNLGGELVGDSTDGPGFVDSLADLGWSPEAKHCLVLGSGGAARAVVLALAEAGAARVDVVGRRRDQVLAAAALAGKVGGEATVGSADSADIIVNATPVGMTGVVGGLDDLPFGLAADRFGPASLSPTSCTPRLRRPSWPPLGPGDPVRATGWAC